MVPWQWDCLKILEATKPEAMAKVWAFDIAHAPKLLRCLRRRRTEVVDVVDVPGSTVQVHLSPCDRPEGPLSTAGRRGGKI